MNRLPALVTALLLTGCGVQPTGVRDGGPPPSDLPEGVRLYFASDKGLRGVARPGMQLKSLDGLLKVLISGPDDAEIANGLTNLVHIEGEFSVSSADGRVTVHLPRTLEGSITPVVTGQVVCTMSRAETLLNGTRPDAVRVTIAVKGATFGPYQCSQFLSG